MAQTGRGTLQVWDRHGVVGWAWGGSRSQVLMPHIPGCRQQRGVFGPSSCLASLSVSEAVSVCQTRILLMSQNFRLALADVLCPTVQGHSWCSGTGVVFLPTPRYIPASHLITRKPASVTLSSPHPHQPGEEIYHLDF